jgi:hypothetical protein
LERPYRDLFVPDRRRDHDEGEIAETAGLDGTPGSGGDEDDVVAADNAFFVAEPSMTRSTGYGAASPIWRASNRGISDSDIASRRSHMMRS